jgi:hypothetical protein
LSAGHGVGHPPGTQKAPQGSFFD